VRQIDLRVVSDRRHPLVNRFHRLRIGRIVEGADRRAEARICLDSLSNHRPAPCNFLIAYRMIIDKFTYRRSPFRGSLTSVCLLDDS
jgi:hypothetical protein